MFINVWKKIEGPTSLVAKLSLIFGVALMLIMIGGVFAFSSLGQDIINQLSGSSDAKVLYLDDFISRQKNHVISWAQDQNLARMFYGELHGNKAVDEAGVESFLQAEVLDHDVLSIEILDLQGIVRATTNPADYGKNYSAEQFFIKGKVAITINDLMFSQELNQPVVGISTPLKYNNEIIGVIVVHPNLRKLSEFIQQPTGFGESGDAFLVNKSHRVLTSVRFPKSLPAQGTLFTEAVSRCLLEQSGFDQLIDYRNVAVINYYRWLPQYNLCLIIKIDQNEAYQPIRNFRTIVLFGLAGIIILLFFFWTLTAFILTRPLKRLSDGVKIIGKGNFDYRIKVESHDEIGKLALAFNDMAENVASAHKGLEEKIQERTHELNQKMLTIENQNAKLEDTKKAMLNLLDDITTEKARSETLANDLQKFKLAVENAGEHIIISDADGIIVYANKAAEIVTGYSRKEMVGKKSGVLWGGHMPKEFYANMWHIIKEQKQIFRGEIMNRRKNGQDYIADVQISPIVDIKGTVTFFVGIERDITKAKEVDKAKSEFVSVASHQLRTPLTGIKWFIELLLLNKKKKLAKDQIESLKHINESNERMIRLVDDLLNVSRIDTGKKFNIVLQRADISAIIKDVVQEQIIVSEKRKIHIIVDASLPEHLYLMADADKIHQALQNIINNAAKYSHVQGEVHIGYKKDKENEIISIKDDGVGIPLDQQGRVFQKFFRAENVMTKQTDGTGLGLYIAKAIIAGHNGKIWFESQEDVGTTFYIALPRYLQRKQPKKSL